MNNIAYDPIKNRFAGWVRKSSALRRLFYFLLDLFFLRSWHIRRSLQKIGSKLDKKGDWKLLDAGSGFGQYDRFILNRFRRAEILSVDVKEDYLEDCRNYFQQEIGEGRIEFRRVDLMDLNYTGEFDVVLCVDVLEHIEDDRTVFQNLSQALKPGGFLLMHSPSHLSEEDARGGDSFVGEHARSGYSPVDLTRKFDEVGLVPKYMNYTYGRYGHLAWVLSVRYPMIWLNRAGMTALVLMLAYYPFVLPLCLALNLADLFTVNNKGNGILACGVKPQIKAEHDRI